MTTKGTVDNIAQRYLVVCEERDELRGEVERLRALIERHNDECRECPVIE